MVHRGDGEDRGVELDGDVLQLLGDPGDALFLAELGERHGDLLQVVNDDQRGLAGAAHDLLDRVVDLGDVGVGRRGAVHDQAVGVLADVDQGLGADAVRRGSHPLEEAAGAAVRALEDGPDLTQAGCLVGVDLAALHGDEPLRQCVGLELVGEEHGRAAGLHRGPGGLKGEHRLALALRAGNAGSGSLSGSRRRSLRPAGGSPWATGGRRRRGCAGGCRHARGRPTATSTCSPWGRLEHGSTRSGKDPGKDSTSGSDHLARSAQSRHRCRGSPSRCDGPYLQVVAIGRHLRPEFTDFPHHDRVLPRPPPTADRPRIWSGAPPRP